MVLSDPFLVRSKVTSAVPPPSLNPIVFVVVTIVHAILFILLVATSGAQIPPSWWPRASQLQRTNCFSQILIFLRKLVP